MQSLVDAPWTTPYRLYVPAELSNSATWLLRWSVEKQDRIRVVVDEKHPTVCVQQLTKGNTRVTYVSEEKVSTALKVVLNWINSSKQPGTVVFERKEKEEECVSGGEDVRYRVWHWSEKAAAELETLMTSYNRPTHQPIAPEVATPPLKMTMNGLVDGPGVVQFTLNDLELVGQTIDFNFDSQSAWNSLQRFLSKSYTHLLLIKRKDGINGLFCHYTRAQWSAEPHNVLWLLMRLPAIRAAIQEHLKCPIHVVQALRYKMSTGDLQSFGDVMTVFHSPTDSPDWTALEEAGAYHFAVPISRCNLECMIVE